MAQPFDLAGITQQRVAPILRASLPQQDIPHGKIGNHAAKTAKVFISQRPSAKRTQKQAENAS